MPRFILHARKRGTQTGQKYHELLDHRYQLKVHRMHSLKLTVPQLWLQLRPTCQCAFAISQTGFQLASLPVSLL